MWCFEEGLAKGARSIDEIVSNWRKRSPEFNDSFKTPFREYLNGVADDLLQDTDLATSRLWNCKVIDLDDDRFEHVKDAKGDLALDDALYMLGAWFWRVLARLEEPVSSELMKLGGSDRMVTGLVRYMAVESFKSDRRRIGPRNILGPGLRTTHADRVSSIRRESAAPPVHARRFRHRANS